MIKKRISSDDIKYILNHSNLTNRELSKHLGLTIHQVRGVFRRSGVRKASSCRDSKGRFVKGSTSWNKGIKMDDKTREKVKRTFFKNGSIPHNAKPVGSIRIYKDNNNKLYKMVKVSNEKNGNRYRE